MSELKINSILNAEQKKHADEVVARYETKRASLLEILHYVMEVKDHITLEDEEAVAEYLEIPPIDVREVMTFYTLYYDKPRCKTRLNVCRTLSCDLMGARTVMKYLEEKLGVKVGEPSKDGKVSVTEVECLGACELAPMLQVNDDEYVGNLNKQVLDSLLAKIGQK